MNTARADVYAKLNLTLDITGAANQFHTLDSLVCTIDIADRVVAKKRKDGLVSVTVRGLGADLIPPEDNNAVKAAERFVQKFGTAGADITVYRNIPVGAGLGSSSADAAGVINALAKLYGIGDGVALKSLADELGSDTGYMLSGGFARLTGRGEGVERLEISERLHFLLLVPKSAVSAGACYRKFDELGASGGSRTERAVGYLKDGNIGLFATALGNDLCPAAKALNPDVEEALGEAYRFSPLGAGMTGSGSAVFALFPTQELCEWAKSRYRGKFRAYVVQSTADKKKIRSPFAL